MMTKTIRLAACIATTLMLAICAPAVQAAPSHEVGGTPQMAVTFSDLDLSTTQGQRKLHIRLAYAADAVCNASGVGDMVEAVVARARCRYAAMNHANADLASRSATKRYLAMTKVERDPRH
jgi:UrcA family protein